MAKHSEIFPILFHFFKKRLNLMPSYVHEFGTQSLKNIALESRLVVFGRIQLKLNSSETEMLSSQCKPLSLNSAFSEKNNTER